MQQRKSNTGLAAELLLAFSSQGEDRDFPGTVPHGGVRDEGAELPSFEALIQAVLNSNTEKD